MLDIGPPTNHVALPQGFRPSLLASCHMNSVQIRNDGLPLMAEFAQDAAEDGTGATPAAAAMDNNAPASSERLDCGTYRLADEPNLALRLARRPAAYQVFKMLRKDLRQR